MNVKAIMCDIDGTLLTNEQIVSSRTISVIKKVREKGILFGLCTGRDVHSVKALLGQWGLDGMVDAIVGTGGAEVCDFIKGVEKASFPLDGALIKDIIEHYKDIDVDVNFVVPDKGMLYVPKDDALIKMLSTYDQIPYEVVDFDVFLQQEHPKLMLVCDEENMPRIIERSKTFHNSQYKSSPLKTASVLYEYMDPRISKTYGLKEIMELHNISMEELCVFGDADNDYDMLENAGVGVVMGNGSERCKSIADYITSDNDHEGIAEFIEREILK